MVEGEELKPLIRGPLDVSDIVLLDRGGRRLCHRLWLEVEGHQDDLKRCLIDPETGAHHNAIDWHYLDSMAQVAGLPYAHSTGRQNEAIVASADFQLDGRRWFRKETLLRPSGHMVSGRDGHRKGQGEEKVCGQQRAPCGLGRMDEPPGREEMHGRRRNGKASFKG